MEIKAKLIDFEKARQRVLDVLAGKVLVITALRVVAAMQSAEVNADDVCKSICGKADGCVHCRAATYVDDLFVVINPHGTKTETQFHFCPNCGRKIPKGE